MSNHESFFGLGFSSTHNPKTTLTTSTNAYNNNGSPSSSTSVVNNMEALMQSYMQQCLSYHEEKLTNMENENENDVDFQKSVSTSTVFIPSSNGTEKLSNQSSHGNDNNDDDNDDKRIQIELENQRKIQKAKEIAMKLASKPIPSQLNNNYTTSRLLQTTTTNAIPSSTNTTEYNSNTYNYAQKRSDFLTKIHSNKLQSYFLKNLNYILKKDEEIHSIQILHLQNQRQQKQQIHQFSNHKRKHNYNDIICTMSGIGSLERNKVQKKIETTHHYASKKNNNRNKQCCGLYITGIKPQSQKEKEQQDMICKLFESYGKVIRSQFYIDKQSGLSKGDALIVYDWVKDESTRDDRVNDEQDDCKMKSFLDMICSQVREGLTWSSSFINVYCVCFNCYCFDMIQTKLVVKL